MSLSSCVGSDYGFFPEPESGFENHLDAAVTYGTLVALARLLGHSDAESLLQKTLDEEKAADHKLTELAMSEINEEARST